jgi:PAT family beta-lactamase induction signal transducer AmpG
MVADTIFCANISSQMNASQPTALFHVYNNPKMAFLLVMGFSSGMPLYLVGQTLITWLSVEGIDLTTIALFSLVGLPYSLKFLWSPLIDRFSLPVLGRRRGWMALSQLLLMASISTIALVGWNSESGSLNLTLIAAAALAVAFFSASQDIVIDAYKIDVLSKTEFGAGAAISTWGYRIALLVTGSAGLILADRIGWPIVYLIMAACILPGLVASIRAPEPKDPGTPPATLGDAVHKPFAELYRRLGLSGTLLTLGFVALYKLGDNVASNMTSPFMLELGFTATDIGFVRGGMGLTATILGVFVGGALLTRLGVWRSLWAFGLLQAGTNIFYFALAQSGHNYPLMVVTINIEWFAQGLGTVALVALLMSLCNRNFSATQFALLSSFIAFNRDVAASSAGFLAQAAGWSGFFLFTIVLAVPALAILWKIRDRIDGLDTASTSVSI